MMMMIRRYFRRRILPFPPSALFKTSIYLIVLLIYIVHSISLYEHIADATIIDFIHYFIVISL